MSGSRNFCPGMREGSSSDRQKTALITFFSPQLISMLFKGFRGGPIFPGAGGGANAYFYRNIYD